MRISSIYIENFKAISKIDISNLPNFVVIVGENGVGKSSIFDAIGFVKSVIGPFNRQDTDWWANKLQQQLPVMAGKNEMKISIKIEPTTVEERRITNNLTAIAGVGISNINSGRPSLSKEDTNGASTLLRSWTRDENTVGGMEYIPANRTFREGQLSLQSTNENDDQFFLQRISQLENKYHDAKQKFANFKTHDEVIHDDSPLFPEAKKLIESLLGKKIEVEFNRKTMAPKILVESVGGYVDIDSLSSGQKELFMTYVGIYSTKLSNSIILFDEPDLHLHASMQKKVLRYLMDFSTSGNQIFITTHSLDMITETPEQNLYHLSNKITNNSQLHTLESEREKVEIFQKLGASKYTFVNFQKIVFLEGESDYKILYKSTPSKYEMKFQHVGGVTKLTPEILSDASRIESFFMIKDRDFMSNQEIADDETKYHHKIHFLKRRHIENYILDSDELFEIYSKHGIKELNQSELIEKLKSIATDQFEQTLSDFYRARFTKNVNFDKVLLNRTETADVGLKNALTRKNQRLQKSIDELDYDLTNLRNELELYWDQNWIEFCSGKDVLTEFGRVYFQPSKKMSEIRDMVSLLWDERKILPLDLETILKNISAN